MRNYVLYIQHSFKRLELPVSSQRSNKWMISIVRPWLLLFMIIAFTAEITYKIIEDKVILIVSPVFEIQHKSKKYILLQNKVST